MPKTLLCECGECKRCRHRAYMRTWYHRHSDHAREWQRRRYAAVGSGGHVSCTCEWCGEQFETTARRLEGHRVKFCSRICKDAARKATDKQVREQAKPERNCRHCGIAMPKAMRADAAYCSEKCNSRAHGLKRGNGRVGHGRRRDIERAYIVERDASRCHICGEKCKPDEITLDHLIPLAKGGTHVPENLRVAHLSCNARKRDRSANDQLMLIG
jgi:5-methylcytosine-specific restriction endonuclease McrA